jgi:flagellar hook protein FlgE
VTPVTIDADANPLTPPTLAASATYDNLTGVISLGTETGTVETFIGTPETVTGLTQTGALEQSSIRLDYKDGSGYGEYKGVEIDQRGIVRAYFTNDQFRPIYQIPVINFANPNDLEPVGAQAYAVTTSAGNMALGNSGEQLSGKIIGYALTKSTVDVAQELTQLIETQRAYSSNAKIIQTVDEMLQETTNIKR